MTTAQARYFVNTLGSKHVALQGTLRLLVTGEKLSIEQLQTVAESDSRLSGVMPIIIAINNGSTANEQTIAAVTELDSFGAPLKPLLLGLIEGLK